MPELGQQFCRLLLKLQVVPGKFGIQHLILKAVKDREDVMSTGFDNGIAIPHPRNPLPDADRSIRSYRFRKNVIGNSVWSTRTPDDRLYSFLYLRKRCIGTHLQILARLGRLIQRQGFVDDLRSIQNRALAGV
jgi:PTS system nitrogen regulatory IIA component